jgi:hypothetical protein
MSTIVCLLVLIDIIPKFPFRQHLFRSQRILVPSKVDYVPELEGYDPAR